MPGGDDEVDVPSGSLSASAIPPRLAYNPLHKGDVYAKGIRNAADLDDCCSQKPVACPGSDVKAVEQRDGFRCRKSRLVYLGLEEPGYSVFGGASDYVGVDERRERPSNHQVEEGWMRSGHRAD
jgi:hypothetical protein